MEPGKTFAKRVLSAWGFQVDAVTEADRKRADLRVSDDRGVYHIEVKDKFEKVSLAEERRSCLASGRIFPQINVITRTKSVSAIFDHARKQLNETPKEPGTHQLIWFHTNGSDPDAEYRQAFATFYGYVHLAPKYPNHGLPAEECVYFDYNAAFRMPDIDALILTDGDCIQCCLNEFAARAREFRATMLFKTFESRNGVFDPAALEAAGKLIACRFNLPRNDDDAIAAALEVQTGVLYAPFG